ncbi:hypothetical protein KFL_004910060 [Klebsormidium nitens]|uniref:Glycosyltransferase n=1 Tax=Klebsormidium nitens TaxID=105231 RepID=A0A1Y1IM07_KLENI|nr:hypothetical protein KFL_004910060 [Klebsormidium nitens]|eukprot:GAQ89148.1 hypothetical protein KFL_004910060 [Klebsormidium nitens]
MVNLKQLALCLLLILACTLSASRGAEIAAASDVSACMMDSKEHISWANAGGEAPVRLSVLVVSPPSSGHFLPLVSIAAELKSRGHDVTFLGLVHREREYFFLKELNRTKIPFHQLGYWPRSLPDDQARHESNAFKAAASERPPFLAFMEGDVASWVGLDRYLAQLADDASAPGGETGRRAPADVMVIDHGFRACGASAEAKYNITPVYVHTWRNFVLAPSWPFSAAALEREVPPQLHSWLSGHSPSSVVLVNLGTVNPLTRGMVGLIIEGLGNVNLDVLWVVKESAWGVLEPFEIPPSFRMEKFIPQREVLRHPAIAAMITHCGNNGVQEALASGIPAIGLPVMYDQFDVAQRLAHAGFPTLHPLRATPADLSAAVRAVTARDPATENVYRAKARKIARIFRYLGEFVEHVAEFGVDHLRTADLDMPFVVKYKLDSSAFAVAVAAIGILSVRFVVRCQMKKLAIASGK